MLARRIHFNSLRNAIDALDAIGTGNSRLMASRAIHLNIYLEKVPGDEAKLLKTVYNDIGAEAAISQDAYFEKEGVVTDMIVMGTVYQHREARRILKENPKLMHLINEIETVVECAPEVVE